MPAHNKGHVKKKNPSRGHHFSAKPGKAKKKRG